MTRRSTPHISVAAEFAALVVLGLLLAGLVATCVRTAHGSYALEWRIHAVLVAQPVSVHDRDEPERKREQLETVASAIAAAVETVQWPGDRRELAALLVTVGTHESHWELAVGAGRCRPGMCDVDRHGRARSVSYWQLQANPWTLPRERWERLAGLELAPTTLAATEAARALRRMRGMCGPSPRRILTAYAGLGCRGRLRDVDERVATYRRVLRRL